MSELAILGGSAVRTRAYPKWPLYTEADRDRLLDVLESGNWGGYPFQNRWAREFGARFAEYHGAKYGCLVTNGTVAITVALRAAGIRFGDEVIVPAYTWDGTATAVLDAGGIPVFADVDPDTYCLSVEAARAAVTPRTKAIVPVHLAMRFADMDGLRALAAEHNLVIMEDCAHAHGGAFKGAGSGSMGDLGTFSFQTSKLMTAGEGGAIITSRLDCYELVQTLVNCGRASETDQFQRRMAGGNYRVSELQSSILIGQLDQLPELTERRARNAAVLREMLQGIDGIRTLPVDPRITREAIYHFVIRYDEGESGVGRDMIAAALEADGVPADGRFYEPVYRSDLFRVNSRDFPQLEGVDYSSAMCPVSERAAYRESLWLPQFLLLGDESDVADVAAAVRKVLAGRSALRNADPALARVKSMSRAERPRVEATKNY